MSALPLSQTRDMGRVRPQDDLGMTGWLGAGAAVLLLVVLVLWAMLTPIGGAVITEGQAVVRGEAKRVQSFDGGIVAAIETRNGERVEAGQVLLRLDATLVSTNLEIARGRLAEALVRQARLKAETLGHGTLAFSYPPLPFAVPETASQEVGQRQIFAARAEVLRGRGDQLVERLEQFSKQIAGVEGQIAAKRSQLEFAERELANVRRLADRGLARQSQALELQRMQADLLGQIAALEADAGRLVNARRDAELETLQANRSFREDVLTELRSVTAEVEELTLEILTRKDQLSRVEIRAPVAGIVHQMDVTTLGAVIAPGERILEIVPLEEGIDFELRLDPRHVDQVWPGQAAGVVIAALSSRTTPTLEGSVRQISPGVVTDPETGARFFRLMLTVPPEELARLGSAELTPGMPVEAYLRTRERSVMAYLLEPLSAQLRRAFREE